LVFTGRAGAVLSTTPARRAHARAPVRGGGSVGATAGTEGTRGGWSRAATGGTATAQEEGGSGGSDRREGEGLPSGWAGPDPSRPQPRPSARQGPSGCPARSRRVEQVREPRSSSCFGTGR